MDQYCFCSLQLWVDKFSQVTITANEFSLCETGLSSSSSSSTSVQFYFIACEQFNILRVSFTIKCKDIQRTRSKFKFIKKSALLSGAARSSSKEQKCCIAQGQFNNDDTFKGNYCSLIFRTVTCVQRQCGSEQNNRHVQHLKKNMNKVTRCQKR